MLLKLVTISSILAILAQSAPLSTSHDTITYAYAIDLSAPVVLRDLQCMKQAGYNAAFVRAYDPSGQGSFDTNVCNTIQSSYYAGLGNEIYMTPQPQSVKQGYQQLDEVYQGLNQCGTNIRSIWIQVTSPNNWLSSPAANVNFINSIVQRANQYGMGVGIYTSYQDWYLITNGLKTLSKDILLWYSKVQSAGVNGETKSNFDDYIAFGNWASPSIKQFAQVERVCQITVNRDVYAVSGSILKAENLKKEDGKIQVGGRFH